MKVTQTGEYLPEGPARWSWRVYLVVTLSSAATIVGEVSEYLVDVTKLLIKDYDARQQDLVRLELESLDEDGV